MKSNLEKSFYKNMNKLDIDPTVKYTIIVFLDLLKVKDYPTYEHSMRVSILSMNIAIACGYDPKPAFIAGALHDIGKALVLPKSLKATVDFSEKDFKELKKHVAYSCRLLYGILDFTAGIVLRHHLWQVNKYPKKLIKLEMDDKISSGTKLLRDTYSRWLSLADYYDAITTRKNNKFGNIDIKKTFLENNRDVDYLIHKLYENNVFTEIAVAESGLASGVMTT